MQNRFDLNDLLDQFNQIRKMGSLRETLAMLPGIGKRLTRSTSTSASSTA